MKIDSFASNGISVQSGGSQAERTVQRKSSAESQLQVKGSSNETLTDVNSESIINDDMIEKAVEQANKTLDGYDKYIERSVHEKTGAIIYVLRDTETKEIIREFPPRKIQDMIAKMWELAGLLIDERR